MTASEKKKIVVLQHPAAVLPQKPKLQSLDSLRSTNSLRLVALLLLLLLLIVALALAFVPWQQSVTGYGQVIIFSPMERPQNIEAQIPGRIVKWNIVEGQAVKAGETIAELEDIDSKFLNLGQSARLNSQRGFMQDGIAEANSRQSALKAQLNDLESSRNAAIPAAEQRARQAEDAVKQAEQNVTQARQSVTTTELNLKRLQELFEKGLRSKRDLELSELEIVTAKTRLESTNAALDVARKAVQVAELEKDRIINDTSAQLNNIRASQASVRESVAKTKSDIEKVAIDLGNVEQRSEQRIVRAPRAGKVVRVFKGGSGETVKSGDVLAVLSPNSQDHAVELYLTDYDAPLVSVGRQVRLNFAGWPAVQFVGWPSIAVGTFAGRVKVMDAIDDGNKRFRVIITPDEELIRSGKEEPWPKLDQLRPGAEVNGWVMLDTVSLGFELWRQFNAFPPTVQRGPIGEKKTNGAMDETKKSDDKDKK